MKKFIPLLFALLVFTACEKDPDLGKVQNEIVTYTQYDKSANFGSASTFYIADSVKIIGKSDTAKYMPTATAATLINTVIAQMTARGYTQSATKANADLGIQMSFVESTYYFAVNYEPYWWNGYPEYWGPGYWGPWWGHWRYRYNNVFSFSEGSLLTDMVNLQTTATSTNQELPVIWQAYTIGLLQQSNQQNLTNMVNGITQAFKQSPYIQAN